MKSKKNIYKLLKIAVLKKSKNAMGKKLIMGNN